MICDQGTMPSSCPSSSTPPAWSSSLLKSQILLIISLVTLLPSLHMIIIISVIFCYHYNPCYCHCYWMSLVLLFLLWVVWRHHLILLRPSDVRVWCLAERHETLPAFGINSPFITLHYFIGSLELPNISKYMKLPLDPWTFIDFYRL